jgi:hypothetical protein
VQSPRPGASLHPILTAFLASLMKEFESENDEIILVQVVTFGELLRQQWTKQRQLMLRNHFDQRPSPEDSADGSIETIVGSSLRHHTMLFLPGDDAKPYR